MCSTVEMDVNTIKENEYTHARQIGFVEHTSTRGSPTDPYSKSETLKLTSKKLVGFRRFLLKKNSRITKVFMNTMSMDKIT
jgi:hypothetical protein